MSENNSSLQLLKDLLLREERDQQLDVERDVDRLREEIKVREKLEQNVEPILSDWFMRFRRDFPKEFSYLFYQTLEKEVQEQPEKVKDTLRPIFESFMEEHQKSRWSRVKNRLGFGPVNEDKDPTELYKEVPKTPVYSDNKVALNDVFVLENENRTLLGMRSKYADKDQEVTSLLLDTVRRMVEDAVLRNGGQALDWVDFNGYKIYLITFKRISVSCVVSGVPSEQYMIDLEDRVMEFAKQLLPDMQYGNFDHNAKVAKRILAQSFPDINK